jgi:hypothetical protein
MRECLKQAAAKEGLTRMSNELIANERFLHEGAVTEKFLDTPNEDSFADLFNTFTPQLIAFFRARSCEPALAEDLAQGTFRSPPLRGGILGLRSTRWSLGSAPLRLQLA